MAQVTKKKGAKEDPRKTPSPAEKKVPGRTPLSQRSETQPKQGAQERQSREDTIVPRGNHPDNATYVARDKKSGAEVSFDSWGRKLDSLGNVVHGDRQRAGDAGAKTIYRPPPPPQPQPEAKPQAKLTGLLSPGRGTTTPYRRDWDRALVPDGPAGAGMGTVGSSATGYNPYRNKSFPPTQPPSMADITGSSNRLGSADNTVPVGTPGGGGDFGGWRNDWMPALEDFMMGNNPYSPVQPKVNIPGFGQLPASVVPATIPMQTEGLNAPYPGMELGRGRWNDAVPVAPAPVAPRPSTPPMYPGQVDPRGRWR